MAMAPRTSAAKAAIAVPVSGAAEFVVLDWLMRANNLRGGTGAVPGFEVDEAIIRMASAYSGH